MQGSALNDWMLSSPSHIARPNVLLVALLMAMSAPTSYNMLWIARARVFKRGIIVLWMIACGLGARPTIAAAHAYPTDEYPRPNAFMSDSPARVAITFDDPIEERFARLQVLNASNVDCVAAVPRVDTDHHMLSAPLKRLAPGTYKVNWSVVAKDGHRTHGSYAFNIVGHR